MMNKVITALQLSAILLALMPAAQAQETVPQLSQIAEPTLSGDSLRTVEARTLDSDYQNFISQPENRRNSTGNGESLGDEFRIQLGQDVDVVTSPSDAQRQGSPLPANQSNNGSDASVQLQLGL
ncbi:MULTISPECIES: hypothetical protein [Kamptonema]|uniref:hypothetical protein n=1 Tax=Kamptonema TaxID=1501433 RepID=UPI0001DAC0F6|nr:MULTISPECIES: hypothetical protein [Kamptonema]CBN55985.1 exported hypothetical protein [Kamptonema sp. PCC 6506]